MAVKEKMSEDTDREEVLIPPQDSKGKEGQSLKRGREGSLEPSSSGTIPIAESTKKNRISTIDPGSRTSPILESATLERTSSSPNKDQKELESGNVGEVRRKVEEMTPYSEHNEGDYLAAGYHSSPSASKSQGGDKTDIKNDWEEISKDEVLGSEENGIKDDGNDDDRRSVGSVKSEGEGSSGLKRKINDTNVKFEKQQDEKRIKETPSPPPESSRKSPKPPPAELPASSSSTTTEASKKPQATFGSFSSTSSPFAKSSSTSAFTSGPSAFASSSSNPSSSASAFGSTNNASSSKSGFASSGFGGFSGSASPFAAKKTSVFGSGSGGSTGVGGISSAKSLLSSAGDEEQGDRVKRNGKNEKKGGDDDAEEDEGVNEENNNDNGGQSKFGDILSGAGNEVSDKEGKIQMSEKDVITGEEDEETVFQTRSKLFVAQPDGNWKERGVGLLRLNVKRSTGDHARLVMRAEGVLRLILNISLYVGMPCLEDGKHVRMTVFEDGERKFVTLRTANPKAASELSEHIRQLIPLESNKKSSSPSTTRGVSESKSPDPVSAIA